MSLQNTVCVEKKRGNAALMKRSILNEGDIGKNVSIKLHFHGTVKGILSDISRSEFEITTKTLWKKVRIVVPRRYVVLLKFAEEGGG